VLENKSPDDPRPIGEFGDKPRGCKIAPGIGRRRVIQFIATDCGIQSRKARPCWRICFVRAMTIPAALHSYVALAKSASGAACADLIKQATSANGVYTFTPLLQAQNVRNVSPIPSLARVVGCLVVHSVARWNRTRKESRPLETIRLGHISRLQRCVPSSVSESGPDSSQRGKFTTIKPPANRETTSSYPRRPCL